MINVKRQTNKITKWHENFANNINVFLGTFQIGITTTKRWGEKVFAKEPKIKISIDGINYIYSISNFKSMIIQDNIFKNSL